MLDRSRIVEAVPLGNERRDRLGVAPRTGFLPDSFLRHVAKGRGEPVLKRISFDVEL